VQAAGVAGDTRSLAGIAAARRSSKPPEPWPNRRQRAHKAARAQQLTPRPAACGQKTIKPILLDLIPVQQAVHHPFVGHGLFDVLADDTRAFFVTATKKPAAVVAVSG